MRIFVLLALSVLLFNPTCASNTTINFQTGPFSGNVDLGMPCNNVTISSPKQFELPSGISTTSYDVFLCSSAAILFVKAETGAVDFNAANEKGLIEFFTNEVNTALIGEGVDKETINISNPVINGKTGAVGSGYVPEGNDVMGYVPEDGDIIYIAGFPVSAASFGVIVVPSNETKMKTIIETINVTEATA